MLEHTKKRHTEDPHEARFVGSRDKIRKLRDMARSLGVHDATETVAMEEAFPEYAANPIGTVLKGYRYREGITQARLAEMTGIPQRHISEIENGKRHIGKERAQKIAKALNVDYRLFL